MPLLRTIFPDIKGSEIRGLYTQCESRDKNSRKIVDDGLILTDREKLLLESKVVRGGVNKHQLDRQIGSLGGDKWELVYITPDFNRPKLLKSKSVKWLKWDNICDALKNFKAEHPALQFIKEPTVDFRQLVDAVNALPYLITSYIKAVDKILNENPLHVKSSELVAIVPIGKTYNKVIKNNRHLCGHRPFFNAAYIAIYYYGKIHKLYKIKEESSDETNNYYDLEPIENEEGIVFPITNDLKSKDGKTVAFVRGWNKYVSLDMLRNVKTTSELKEKIDLRKKELLKSNNL